MSILKLRTWGDPILKTRAVEISASDSEIRELVEDMFQTMEAEGGVGLAANQVGVARRVFVAVIPAKVGPPLQYVLINPRITARSPETETEDEGCLSFPGITGPVARAAWVEIEGQDLEGKPIRLRTQGLLARACQHELDHLDGIVFIERMPLVQRLMLNRQLRELARQTKQAITLRRVPKI